MVGNQLCIFHLIPAGVPFSPCAFQCRICRIKLRFVLIPCHSAYSVLLIQFAVTGVVLFCQIVIRKSRLIGRLVRIIALPYILGIKLHQHLPGADRISQINGPGHNLAACLKGKIAFILSPHFARIRSCTVRNCFPDGHGAHHRNGPFFCCRRLQYRNNPPSHKSNHSNTKQNKMFFCQFNIP